MYRKRLLLDVDGVLGDFHLAARDLIHRKFGLDFPMEKFLTWDVTSVLPNQEMKDSCNQHFAEPGFATSLTPFPEAQEAVKEIRSIEDVELLFVTTPHHISKTWMQERNEWLAEHFGAKQDEVIHCFRKYAVIGHALVDDKPANIKEWSSHHPGGHALLWGTPYNSNETELNRITSWEEVIRIFKD